MLIRNFLEKELHETAIHDGCGLCRHATIIGGSEIEAPISFINYTVLPLGASFGVHKHGADNEFYMVLEGRGVYEENGVKKDVHTGDIIMNAPYGEHAIVNTGDTELRLIVLSASIAAETPNT